jgi:hypothetical protein
MICKSVKGIYDQIPQCCEIFYYISCNDASSSFFSPKAKPEARGRTTSERGTLRITGTIKKK